MKTSWVLFKNYLFYLLVRVILLSSWVIQEHLVVQRTFPSFVCCLLWKEWFFPSIFLFTSYFFLLHPIFRKKTQFCLEISCSHKSYSNHPSFLQGCIPKDHKSALVQMGFTSVSGCVDCVLVTVLGLKKKSKTRYIGVALGSEVWTVRR